MRGFGESWAEAGVRASTRSARATRGQFEIGTIKFERNPDAVYRLRARHDADAGEVDALFSRQARDSALVIRSEIIARAGGEYKRRAVFTFFIFSKHFPRFGRDGIDQNMRNRLLAVTAARGRKGSQ